MIREIFGKKLGMTQIFTETGQVKPVTLIEVGPCQVLEEKEVSGKTRVVIGYDEISKVRRQKKPLAGYFKKLDVAYFRHVRETEKTGTEPFEKGKSLGVDIFAPDEKVDIQAVSIGRGFQGGMKRHNWAGQPGSHGSTSHRRIGSTGASAYPSRIVKGLNMPGHMGNAKVTIKNLKILKVDSEKGLLFVKGSCAGPKNNIVIIRKHA